MNGGTNRGRKAMLALVGGLALSLLLLVGWTAQAGSLAPLGSGFTH